MQPDEFLEIRLALQLTQAALAAVMESDTRTVRRWENGEREIPGPVRVLMRMLMRTAPVPPA